MRERVRGAAEHDSISTCQSDLEPDELQEHKTALRFLSVWTLKHKHV